MMSKRSLPVALLALCMSAAGAAGQGGDFEAPGAGAGPVQPQPRALYTGIEFSVSAQRNANGTVALAYPTVRHVVPGSPADSAGVAVGDLIIEINGQDIRTQGAALRPAAPNTYRLRTGDEEREVVITTIFPPSVRRPGG